MRSRIPILICFIALSVLPTPARQDDKARSLFEQAIAAMGGEKFTSVKDIVSNGHFFLFNRRGKNSNRIKFDDYTKLPNKSRNEIGNNKKIRDITVFNLEKNEGWILEGQKPTRDATAEELQDFKTTLKHVFENIFRSRYEDPANKLFYFGPGQGSELNYEIVTLLDPENDEVKIYFDRLTKLPAKISYRITDKEGIPLRYVEEYSQWHVIQGVKTPLRLDRSVNGRRSSQLFIFEIAYNTGLQDSFFTKPLPPK